MMVDGWQAASIAAVALSFAVSGILIGFSRIFAYKELEQWAKAEMVFAVSTLLLVFMLIALFTQGQLVAVEIAKSLLELNYAQQGAVLDPAVLQHQVTLLDVTKFYMGNIYYCMVEVFRCVYYVHIPFAFASSFSVEAFMCDTLSGWFLGSIVQTVTNISNQIAFMAFLYYVFIHILNFIAGTALPIFLPVGVLLRAFPPTRGAGAYVLAFTIGFYFIFPLAYLLMANLSPAPFICGFSVCGEIDFEMNHPYLCGLQNPGKPHQFLLFASATMSQAQNLLYELQQWVSGMCINICCLPFMAMIVTMSFILSGTNLLGANLPEIGRGFVKLI